MPFDRTEAAAAAMKKSLKGLAEALALDIPEGTDDIQGELLKAKKVVEKAGEPRSAARLKNIRKVGLYVQHVNMPERFDWVVSDTGSASYTLHEEAYQAGWVLAKLADEYANGITVSQIRESQGRQGNGFDKKPQDRDALLFNAWSEIMRSEHDIEQGDYTPGSQAAIARHFGTMYIRDKAGIAQTELDTMHDDVEAFLKAQV